MAYAHVNDELRESLPEFMRARSCPWSLSTREEWVWCVPDLPTQPLPPKTSSETESTESSMVESEAVPNDSTTENQSTPSNIPDQDTTGSHE